MGRLDCASRTAVDPLRCAERRPYMNLGGLPGHIPDRREAIRGGCGENVLFSTLRRMTRESVRSTGGDTCVEPCCTRSTRTCD